MSSTRLWSVGIVFVGLFVWAGTGTAQAFKRVAIGEAAPTWTLPDLDGNPVALEDARGAPLTVLTFWATWSSKSLPLLEDLQTLADRYGDRGLKVLTVNVEGPDAPADLVGTIRDLFAANGLTLPVVIDKDLEQYNRWGVIATPATAYLDTNLVVTGSFAGHPTSTSIDMAQTVEKSLGIEAAAKAPPRHIRYQAKQKRTTLHYGLAHTLYLRGQFAKAGKRLRDVLEAEPLYPDAHALAGAVWLGLELEGKPDAASKAREAFAEAVRLDPELPLALAGTAHFERVDAQASSALDTLAHAVANTDPADLPDLPALADPPEAPGDDTPEIEHYLTEAKTSLEAGNLERANQLIDRVVDGLLDFPQMARTKGGHPADKMKKLLEK